MIKKILSIFILIIISIGNNNSVFGQNKSYEYLFPNPDSKFNSPGTTIAIRFDEFIDPSSINDKLFFVEGSTSGEHKGKVILASDNRTIIFDGDKHFSLGEYVSVEVRSGIVSTRGEILPSINFGFFINEIDPTFYPEGNLLDQLEYSDPNIGEIPTFDKNQKTEIRFETAPSDLPTLQIINEATNQVGEGYIFLSNFLVAGFGSGPNDGSYLLILDNAGDPVYYQKVPVDTISADFKVLSNGNLAYWQDGKIYVLDNHYNLIRTISAGNGFENIDVHEILLLPNGNLMYLIYYNFIEDMSEFVDGGQENAYIIDVAIQEQDPDGNIVFEWRGIDHYKITETNRDLTAAQIDYAHSNALSIDGDGNILLSSRHLDEITKINHDTGDIIWRLSSNPETNDFTFISSTEIGDTPNFYMQHDVRSLQGQYSGNISLFDNHNNAVSGDNISSRVQIFDIDEVTKTADFVWQFKNVPEVYSNFMGNAQELSNGNFVIGWGGISSPSVTEISEDGDKLFEIGLPDPYLTYRAYRFLWEGYPTWVPELAIKHEVDLVSLFMSWNGATNISEYVIYGRNFGAEKDLITSIKKNRFETLATLDSNDSDYCFYQIMPLDDQGQETLFSNEVKNPSCNLIIFPFVINN